MTENTPARVLASQSANAWWSVTTDESGWNPSSERALRSSSRSRATAGQEAEDKIAVLLVEDNYADILLIEEAVREYGLPIALQIVRDGERAIEFIDHIDSDENAPCPKVLLLDLNLPKRSGLEILEHVRQSTKCRHIPVIIVTSSDSSQDREETARLGATHYFRKGMHYDQFLKLGEVLKQVVEQMNKASNGANG